MVRRRVLCGPMASALAAIAAGPMWAQIACSGALSATQGFDPYPGAEFGAESLQNGLKFIAALTCSKSRLY
jgi:hypothetical protein